MKSRESLISIGRMFQILSAVLLRDSLAHGEDIDMLNVMCGEVYSKLLRCISILADQW